MYKRFYEFLIQTERISPQQFGFLSQSNTSTAALHAISLIQRLLNDSRNKATAAVFIDIAKAFDSVDHCILINKLSKLGIRGKANEIIQNYLFARKQVVKVNEMQSEIEFSRYGIPQGSSLSSLLFLIYVNDCLDLPLTGYIQLYADDTILIYTSKDLGTLHNDIQNDLVILNQWMYENSLSFNAEKTKYMLFKRKNQTTQGIMQPIIINNKMIEETETAKYLGLIIDHKLSWKQHIEYVKSKLTPYLYILRHTKYTLPMKTKISLYYSYFNSNLSYMIPIWGYSTMNNLMTLQRTQNKVIRTLFWQDYQDPSTNTDAIYKKYAILKIDQLTIFNSLVMIFKIRNNLIRNNFQLTTFTDMHSYDTRGRNNFMLPASNVNVLYESCLVRGLSQYNELPIQLRNETQLKPFKKQLRMHILGSR